MTANFADLLRAAAGRAPDGVALVDAGSGATTTWQALDDAVSRVAQGLERLGLVAGNRVVLVTRNRPELVVALLAVTRARLVAVPVNPRAQDDELRRVLEDSGARLVLADGSTVDGVRRAAAPRVVVLDVPPAEGELAYDALLEGAEPAAGLAVSRDPEALAALLYTSGASATARAAMVSHRALLAQAEQLAQVERHRVTSGDVVYGALPLCHVYGLSGVLGQVLLGGATLVLADGPEDAEAALTEIERYAVTVAPVPPQLVRRWRGVDDLAERLGRVRLLVCASEPLPPDVVVELLERSGLTVHQGYGLTEAGAAVTSTLASRTVKPGSVGSALPGVRLRLLDDSGREPEGADPGQVHVAGDQLFDGYWPDGADGPVDGWFATGDLGFLDSDGDLFLVDRLRDTVVVSGFSVYPREVEEVLLDVEGVSAAAVVGVPDDETGEAVVAWVQVAAAQRAGVEERVAQACATRLARFKQPARVEVVDELPRTASGKVAKRLLRSAARHAPRGDAGDR